MRAFLIKSILRLLALLPLRITHRFATFLGIFLAKRPPLRITHVTTVNIGICYPQLSESERCEWVKQSLIETCKTFSELGAVWLWSPQKTLNLIKTVSGEEHLQQAYQQRQGVILLTPHLGAWEMAGLYASSRYPLTALYRPPKLIGLDSFIHSARERAGGHYVAATHHGVRALYRTLQRGEVVGILPDQVPPDANSGLFAPFFGIPAYTMVLVARLTQKTNAPVIFTYAERFPQGEGFRIHFLPAPDEIASKTLATAVHALNQGIETCIQQCPTQYQWSYKRFKKRPLGEPSFYSI